MPDEDRDAITSCLGVEPVEIDSALVSACHRQRYYWTNLPVSPPCQRDIDIDSLLDPGWRRTPTGKPFRCFVASAAWQARRGREPLGVCRASDGADERPPNADEREAILGFPRGHTRMRLDDGEELPEGARLKMLGNSFSVQVVAHLLAPLAAHAKEGRPLELRPLREGALVLTMDRIVDCGDDDGEEEALDDLW
eukprot:CAMPEP_0204554280 /NCGR_PEP_ID=MMETSP0661-20131031/27983_1 /ASSEMBLY_ACC=CAM_ASM_000606 /TAXON_ID=109239 /ORGANISM="Alexandrium margalefi, Strain AMGDE01CS-322" /LENGTH=194 /DNA_ID=CAMNT_0051561341 /DNA_START=15 /DNA_END=596 /DNA_ORIENTATION=-